jgi:hypothetical protein
LPLHFCSLCNLRSYTFQKRIMFWHFSTVCKFKMSLNRSHHMAPLFLQSAYVKTSVRKRTVLASKPGVDWLNLFTWQS